MGTISICDVSLRQVWLVHNSFTNGQNISCYEIVNIILILKSFKYIGQGFLGLERSKCMDVMKPRIRKWNILKMASWIWSKHFLNTRSLFLTRKCRFLGRFFLYFLIFKVFRYIKPFPSVKGSRVTWTLRPCQKFWSIHMVSIRYRYIDQFEYISFFERSF